MDKIQEEKYKNTLRAARDTIRSLTETTDSLKQRLAAPGAPIAIIGMAGEFPGAGTSAESFRQMLINGLDTTQEIPSTRWNHDSYYSAKHGTPGKYYCKRASFIARDPFSFDYSFFNLTRAEAEMMDPQQRILLNQSHHALEDAGIPPSSLRGTDTGVFLGISSFDHMMSCGTHDLQTRSDPYTLTGASFNSAPGRLSYFYDIHGPCTAFDTACSSSLIALLAAVEALRKGDCPLAFAGGVSLMLSPLSFVALSAIHALSEDGLCRAFGEGATGFGRGEGCGIVILKRLDAALADNDRIHAVILGGATGHDGQSAGFTAPSGIAQRRVIERAMRDAGIVPDDMGYLETHGTGTDLGDPIETAALSDTFGKRRTKLLIGSVKSNVGHLEAAAGMPALLKTVFSVRDGEISPSLHAEQLSSRIDWQALPLEVCRERTVWPAIYSRRIAGISSFGISGTLAHLIISAPPERKPASAATKIPDWNVLAISAKTEDSLAHLASSCTTRLQESGLNYGAFCSKAASGRDHFTHRMAVCARDSAEAAVLMNSFFQKKKSRDIMTGIANRRPKVAFLFSGQGSQAQGMGQALYQTNRVFQKTMEDCSQIVFRQLGVSLCDVMFDSDATRLNRTCFTQPAIFAMGAALTDMWRSFGIHPAVVAGHSIGEYAAAYAANVITLEQGMEIVLERARLADSISSAGRMAAILTDEETVQNYLKGTDADLAAVNGNNVTISGSAELITAICASVWKDGIAFREMPVSQAFHSRMIEPVLGDFERFLKGQEFKKPDTRFISTMTAEEFTDNTDWHSYWRDQMRRPVLFGKALKATEQADLYLEIGASPTLTSLCRTKADNNKWLFSQGPGVPAWKQVGLTLARLYTEGFAINLSSDSRDRFCNMDLPLYPFHSTAIRPPQTEAQNTIPPTAIDQCYSEEPSMNAMLKMQTMALNRLFEWQRLTIDRLNGEQ